MHDAEGVGLAATQIGILRRFFVCTLDGEDRVLVNPVVTPRRRRHGASTTRAASRSGRCACRSSAPPRSGRGARRDGAPVALELEGMAARVVQHEVDHLDGVLMLDRTDAEARREALAQLRPRLVLTSSAGVARIAVAATAPFGADVLERLAGATRRLGAADAAGRTGRPGPADRGTARPRRSRSASGSPCCSRSGRRPGLDLGAPTVVVCAYGLLIPRGAPRRADVAQRPSVAPSALARRRARSSGRSWRATPRRASRSTRRSRRSTPGRSPRRRRSRSAPDDDAGAVFARRGRGRRPAARRRARRSRARRSTPQEGEPTYAEKIRPEDRVLDLERPAEELVRVVRAL